ncbi:MAG: hypothetical protein FWD57_17315, partial [Polyangiaceae bacterium]|nr:hypothetical protein [Polyangiaceae bacterium]
MAVDPSSSSIDLSAMSSHDGYAATRDSTVLFNTPAFTPTTSIEQNSTTKLPTNNTNKNNRIGSPSTPTAPNQHYRTQQKPETQKATTQPATASPRSAVIQYTKPRHNAADVPDPTPTNTQQEPLAKPHRCQSYDEKNRGRGINHRFCDPKVSGEEKPRQPVARAKGDMRRMEQRQCSPQDPPAHANMRAFDSSNT